MKPLTSAALVGLPALIGVILGLKAYAEGARMVQVLAGLLLIAMLLLGAGRRLMAKRPVLAGFLIEGWVLSAIAVTALATDLVTWVALSSPVSWLIQLPHPDKQLKTVTDTFVAAVTTYVALVWTKDIGDAKGVFWPSTQFKAAIAAAYGRLKTPPLGETPAYQAMFGDYIEGVGEVAWDFDARRTRARTLADYVQRHP